MGRAPEEPSRFLPCFSRGVAGARVRREEEPGALPLSGDVLAAETPWRFAGKRAELCIAR